jgi:hypothetical protein
VSDRSSSRTFVVQGKQSFLVERLQENTTFNIDIAAVNGRGNGMTSSVTVTTKEIPFIKSKRNLWFTAQ